MNPLQNLRDVLKRIKSELTNRQELERLMERRLGRVWKQHRAELMRLLGDPPSMSNVPEAYWNNGGKEIRQAVATVLEEIYIIQATALAEQVNLVVDWTMVNRQAIDWAARWGMQLSNNLNRTTRDAVTELVQGYFTNSWTIDELTEKIARFYSPARARTVAITETTNAAVQSQIQTANDLSRMYNVHFIETWRVSEYDRVCEECAPKEGHLCSEVGYPPEHINCACYVAYSRDE